MITRTSSLVIAFLIGGVNVSTRGLRWQRQRASSSAARYQHRFVLHHHAHNVSPATVRSTSRQNPPLVTPTPGLSRWNVQVTITIFHNGIQVGQPITTALPHPGHRPSLHPERPPGDMPGGRAGAECESAVLRHGDDELHRGERQHAYGRADRLCPRTDGHATNRQRAARQYANLHRLRWHASTFSH